jgi:hypothetical protein
VRLRVDAREWGSRFRVQADRCSRCNKVDAVQADNQEEREEGYRKGELD